MSRIRLVVSDVDGTLLTPDKQLTAKSCNAVMQLNAEGIGFSVTSARPPFGLRMLIEPLNLHLPLGAYNGALIFDGDMRTIEAHTLPPDVVDRSITRLTAAGAGVWLFSPERWLIRDPGGDYVAHEQHTVAFDPTVVPRFTADHMSRVCKIVGVSRDFDLVRRCEADVKDALGPGAATVVRSQTYYLDITPAGLDKGTSVEAIARHAGVSMDEVATIGDMDNDLPMLTRSGLSVAMGNAEDHIKKQATLVARANTDEGFADAIMQIIRHRAD